jgi:hypothetical protein
MKCLCIKNYEEKSILPDFEITFESDNWYEAEDLGLSYRVIDSTGNSMVFSIFDVNYNFNDYFMTNYEVKKQKEELC